MHIAMNFADEWWEIGTPTGYAWRDRSLQNGGFCCSKMAIKIVQSTIMLLLLLLLLLLSIFMFKMPFCFGCCSVNRLIKHELWSLFFRKFSRIRCNDNRISTLVRCCWEGQYSALRPSDNRRCSCSTAWSRRRNEVECVRHRKPATSEANVKRGYYKRRRLLSNSLNDTPD